MSLVAYASSEESESDSEMATESMGKAGGGLFSSLPPPRQDFPPPPPLQSETASYPAPYPGEQEQQSPGYYAHPGVYGLGYPPGYGPPPNYGPSSYNPPNYAASPGPPGYGGYNSQGPGAASYPNMGYNPQGPTPTNFPPPGLNMPPLQGAHGLNLPPRMTIPPPQGAPGMNLPPPQGGHGMGLPPPQVTPGMNLPPPHGGPGMNLPPPQGGPNMSLPPHQGGPNMNVPPPQGPGMNLPPPQNGPGMNLPPPQNGPGMNLPPQNNHGVNLPHPQGVSGLHLPPHQNTHGLSLPPPQNNTGLNLPPPQGGIGMGLPPPQSGLGLNLPPPMGGHAMNIPPPQIGPGLNLPPPMSGQGLNIPPLPRTPTSPVGTETLLPVPPPKLPGHGMNLPPPENEIVGNSKPKKRSEPVKISIPELSKGDSDSEEDEPTKKKSVGQASKEGFGLSSLLPQPKNAPGGDSKRPLLPYVFTKKTSDTPRDTKHPKAITTTKPKLKSNPEVSNTPSPSAIKAAAKNAALQVTKQIAQEEDEESDEEVQKGNFFSLSESNDPPAATAESYTYSIQLPSDDGPPGVDPTEMAQNDAANAPLEFKTAIGPSPSQQWQATSPEGYSGQQYNQYTDYNNPSTATYYPQDYYSGNYYQESEQSSTAPREATASDSFMDDEAFKRLQGKRNRGREEINFVEIKGDDQLSGNQQWLTKSLTEEKNMKSFSKKKGEQPTGQQRRKHQITYLIHQAKERELELKNTWSENKMSRRQTQAKYGF